MKQGGADLHAHTTASDGRLSPSELVEAAVAAELDLLAITDHDTVAGVVPARQAAADTGLEVVAGIEISMHAGKRELHLLGLWVDPESDPLTRLASRQVEFRRERAERMVARVRELGLPLDMAVLEETAAGAPIGRPHVARAMIRTGAVTDFDDAFRRFIGVGRPCFVPRAAPVAEDAIATVHAAGGVAVLAHPGASRAREGLIQELRDLGLDGVEVRHPRHGRQRERLLAAICDRLGLLPSGGSDFHAPGPGNSRVGQYRVETEWAAALRARARERVQDQ